MENWDEIDLCKIVEDRKPDFKFQFDADTPFSDDDLDTYVPAFLYNGYILINVGVHYTMVDVYKFVDNKMQKEYEEDDSYFVNDFFTKKFNEAYREYQLTSAIEKEMKV